MSEQFPNQPPLPPKEHAEWQGRLREIHDAVTAEQVDTLFTLGGIFIHSLRREGLVTINDEQLMRATLMRLWSETLERFDDV